MSLIGIGAKIGYSAGKSLPSIVKGTPTALHATSVAIHKVTLMKAVVFTGHALFTTVKVAGAGVAAVVAAHWVGF